MRRAVAMRASAAWLLAAVLIGEAGAADPPEAAPVRFTDVTGAAGIEFVQTIGDGAMTNIVESTGVGCGFTDFDGDGWLDVYLVNGCWKEGISDPDLDAGRRKAQAAVTDRLYRNRGDGTFEDVTRRAGLAHPAYGMAVVAADYDGDGDRDLYVTNHGPNFLYRNNGDGTFTDVAEAAGVADDSFGVGAVFLDYDADGRLDLFLGNYITYDPEITPEHARDIVRSPLAYDGQPDRLFRGDGRGKFTDVTREAGLVSRRPGRAMGVGAFDHDGDGRLDIFVSNDAMENHLWRNRGDGTFEDVAPLAGVAFSEFGAAAAAMAVEVADQNGDGLLDILVPDMNVCCLYRNLGGGLFEDVSVRAGLAVAMARYHSWGGVLADLDLDGRIDAFLADGSASTLGPQENALFLGDGSGRLRDVSREAGPALAAKATSRGVARGDFDNDGDLDLLVNNLEGRPQLLRNDTPRRGRHWLLVELVPRSGSPDPFGAVVRVTAGGRTIVQALLPAGSYLSQHDPRLHFGLGTNETVEKLEVIWPDGARETRKDVRADRQLVLPQVAE